MRLRLSVHMYVCVCVSVCVVCVYVCSVCVFVCVAWWFKNRTSCSRLLCFCQPQCPNTSPTTPQHLPQRLPLTSTTTPLPTWPFSSSCCQLSGKLARIYGQKYKTGSKCGTNTQTNKHKLRQSLFDFNIFFLLCVDCAYTHTQTHTQTFMLKHNKGQAETTKRPNDRQTVFLYTLLIFAFFCACLFFSLRLGRPFPFSSSAYFLSPPPPAAIVRAFHHFPHNQHYRAKLFANTKFLRFHYQKGYKYIFKLLILIN